MTHFAFFLGFSIFISILWGAMADGDVRRKLWTGGKTFLEFFVIGMILAWIFFYIPA